MRLEKYKYTMDCVHWLTLLVDCTACTGSQQLEAKWLPNRGTKRGTSTFQTFQPFTHALTVVPTRQVPMPQMRLHVYPIHPTRRNSVPIRADPAKTSNSKDVWRMEMETDALRRSAHPSRDAIPGDDTLSHSHHTKRPILDRIVQCVPRRASMTRGKRLSNRTGTISEWVTPAWLSHP